MPSKHFSLRSELHRLTEAQQLPILLIMFAFWIVCAVEAVQHFAGTTPDPRFWPLLSLIVTVYSGLQVFRLHRSTHSSAQCPSSESEVARILDEIRCKGFVAFHNLPGTGRNIDHVVVGPAGIYAIETKVRRGAGTIEYDGEENLIFGGRIKDGRPLRDARGSASTVQTRLNDMLHNAYAVKPLVVFLGNWDISRHGGNSSADITTADELADYFDRQAPELTGKEISAISACFESSAAA